MLRRLRNNEAGRKSVGGPGAQPERPPAERPRAHRSPTTPAAETALLAHERPVGGAEVRTSSTRQRRREPATEDLAVYSCECGFIFQADVSTSVGCPHCGGAQAW